MKSTIFTILLGLFLVGCSNSTEKKTAKRDPYKEMSKQEMITRIENLDKKLAEVSDFQMMVKLANEQHTICSSFADRFVEDDRRVNFLYLGAHAARTAKKYKKAVKLYNDVIKGYPDFEKRAEAIFLKAFVLDEDLSDKEKAKNAYSQLIREYPNHQLSKDAQLLMEQLFMTDEEIMKMLEEKNKEI